MKTFNVKIRATYVKTVRVEAEDQQAAEDAAHEDFSIHDIQIDEDYNEEILEIEELTSDPE